MTYEQKRLETYALLDQILGNFMNQNQVSAAMMEDALNKCLLSLKDRVTQEFISAVIQDTNSQLDGTEEGEIGE